MKYTRTLIQNTYQSIHKENHSNLYTTECTLQRPEGRINSIKLITDNPLPLISLVQTSTLIFESLGNLPLLLNHICALTLDRANQPSLYLLVMYLCTYHNKSKQKPIKMVRLNIRIVLTLAKLRKKGGSHRKSSETYYNRIIL